MIGNDIVDLNLAKIQSNWQRKGFLEKQFTDFEINEIVNSDNPFLKVWLFWSMKEAAYKCFVQKHQKRFFAPRKISCKIVSETKGIVKIESEKYYIKYIISNNYIESVAKKDKGKKMVSKLFLVDENVSLSQKINDKLLSLFGDDTQLQKNDLGIPYLTQNNKKLDISISKSHHGNYGGFALMFN